MSQVLSTKDYNQFQLIGSNRGVNRRHVNELKESMKQFPDLFPSFPVTVNENMFVIDGQHRLAAAKELGATVYYTVAEDTNLDTVRVVNTTQKRWTLMDYAQSYANEGREDYKTFMQAVRKYPSIPPSTILSILGGSSGGGSESNTFRKGMFTIADIGQSLDELDLMIELGRKVHQPIKGSMASAISALLRGKVAGADNFKMKRLLEKLELSGAVDRFVQGNRIEDNLRTLEEVYNFAVPNDKRVRLF